MSSRFLSLVSINLIALLARVNDQAIEIESKWYKSASRSKLNPNPLRRHFGKRQEAALILLTRAHNYASHYL